MASTEPTKKTPISTRGDTEETVIHVTTTSDIDRKIHEADPHPYTPIPSAPSSSSTRTRALVLMFLVVVVAIGAFSLSSNNKSAVSTGTASLLAAPAPGQVSVTSTGFVPATVTVKVGQAVTWTNTDSAPHVIASDPYPTDNALSGFDSQQDLSTNDRYSFVFDKAGTYTYHDDLNPYTLEGTVIVKQ
jgi:plastocyanin